MTERPVVYVHGWMGKLADAQETAALLTKAMGTGYKVFAFGYSAASHIWGAAGSIGTCLDDYLAQVSESYQKGGGFTSTIFDSTIDILNEGALQDLGKWVSAGGRSWRRRTYQLRGPNGR